MRNGQLSWVPPLRAGPDRRPGRALPRGQGDRV